MTESFGKIHIYTDYMLKHASPEALAPFEGRELIPLPDNEAFLDAIGDIEVLFGFGMDRDHWAEATSLRLIQWMGAGVDALLPAVGLPDSVIVANAKGSHEPQLPEFAIAALFTMNFGFAELAAQQADHVWRIRRSTPLTGKTLCVNGLGTIGQSIARRAIALGMRVVGVRRSGEPVDGVDKVVTPDRRLEVMDGADALVTIAPLTEETRGQIGAAEFAALKPGALFVDVGRGGVTDVDAAVEALQTGQLGAATIDVFETEPLPTGSPYWDVPNLAVTPHTSGWSGDYIDRLFRALHTNLTALERGEMPPTAVDRSRGY